MCVLGPNNTNSNPKWDGIKCCALNVFVQRILRLCCMLCNDVINYQKPTTRKDLMGIKMTQRINIPCNGSSYKKVIQHATVSVD